MGDFVRVTGTTDVKAGSGIVAEVNGKTLAVFNVDGSFHVIDNTCVHRGGPLGEGDLAGHVVTSMAWVGIRRDDRWMREQSRRNSRTVSSESRRNRRQGAPLISPHQG